MNINTDTATPPRFGRADWAAAEPLVEPQTPVAFRAPVLESDPALEQQIRRSVWGLLASLYPSPRQVDRRKEQRYPFPYLVRLWPTDESGTAPCGSPMVVVGKQLSERGMGFYHPRPLANRRMVAVLDSGQGQPLALLLDVSWCRFTSQGWYESGGRFLDIVPMP